MARLNGMRAGAVMGCVAGCVASAAVVAGQPAGGANGEEKAARAFTDGPVLVVEWAEPRSWMTHGKDKAFGAALGLIPARVRELAEHPMLGLDEGPRELISRVVPMLGHAGRLSVRYSETPTGGLYGYGAQLSLRAKDEAEATGLQALVLKELKGVGRGPQPRASKRFPGMTDFQFPFGIVSFGPRKAGEEWRYEAVVGTFDASATDGLPAVPDGVRAHVRARLDFRGLTPAKDLALQFAGANAAQAEPLVRGMEQLGIVGPGAMALEAVYGVRGERSVSVTTLRNAKAHARKLGLGMTGLTAAQIAAIPSDATSAFMVRMSDALLIDVYDGLLEQIAKSGEEDAERAIVQMRARLGMDPGQDLLKHLGGTFGYYMSDSTGGGGLGSAVALVSVRDRAKFGEGMTRLAETTNRELTRVNEGRPFRIHLAKVGGIEGADAWAMRFDGLPVPLEVTAVLTADWLIIAGTPQAATAAARQAMGKGDAGITSVATVKSVVPMGAGEAGLVAIGFTDSARKLRDGYTGVTLVGSALANAVRSPVDGSRDPGMVVPLYKELAAGVQPSVSWAVWKGEDLVNESVGDPSQLVQLGASLGSFSGAFSSLGSIIAPVIEQAGRRRGLGMLLEHQTRPMAGEGAWDVLIDWSQGALRGREAAMIGP